MCLKNVFKDFSNVAIKNNAFQKFSNVHRYFCNAHMNFSNALTQISKALKRFSNSAIFIVIGQKQDSKLCKGFLYTYIYWMENQVSSENALFYASVTFSTLFPGKRSWSSRPEHEGPAGWRGRGITAFHRIKSNLQVGRVSLFLIFSQKVLAINILSCEPYTWISTINKNTSI